MSLRAIPLIAIAFILYNVVVFFGNGSADEVLHQQIFKLTSFRAPVGGTPAVWTFNWGDLIILIMMVLLFVEILKSTYTSTTSLVDHGLSMLVMMAAGAEFLLVDKAFTSVFFLILVAAMIDVIAGYTIGIRVARRDLSIGGST